jgi:arsenite methyltransferase
VIVDYTNEAVKGPPAHYRLPESAVVEEFSRAGYRLAKKHGFLPRQYFLEFTPK